MNTGEIATAIRPGHGRWRSSAGIRAEQRLHRAGNLRRKVAFRVEQAGRTLEQNSDWSTWHRPKPRGPAWTGLLLQHSTKSLLHRAHPHILEILWSGRTAVGVKPNAGTMSDTTAKTIRWAGKRPGQSDMHCFCSVIQAKGACAYWNGADPQTYGPRDHGLSSPLHPSSLVQPHSMQHIIPCRC